MKKVISKQCKYYPSLRPDLFIFTFSDTLFLQSARRIFSCFLTNSREAQYFSDAQMNRFCFMQTLPMLFKHIDTAFQKKRKGNIQNKQGVSSEEIEGNEVNDCTSFLKVLKNSIERAQFMSACSSLPSMNILFACFITCTISYSTLQRILIQKHKVKQQFVKD